MMRKIKVRLLRIPTNLSYRRTSQLLLPAFCAIQTRCFFIAVLLVDNAVRAAYGIDAIFSFEVPICNLKLPIHLC